MKKYEVGDRIAGVLIIEIVRIKYAKCTVSGLKVRHDQGETACGGEAIYRLSYLTELKNHSKKVTYCKNCRARGPYTKKQLTREIGDRKADDALYSIQAEQLSLVESHMPVRPRLRMWCDRAAVRFI